jgi:hypothetical protein
MQQKPNFRIDGFLMVQAIVETMRMKIQEFGQNDVEWGYYILII